MSVNKKDYEETLLDDTITLGTSGIRVTTDVAGTPADGFLLLSSLKSIFDAFYARIAINNIFTKSQRVAPVALGTTTGSIDIDLSLSNNFTLTPTGNFTLANPTNIASYVGMHFTVNITQTATPRTIAFGAYWKSSDGTAQSLSTTNGAVNVLACRVDTATQITYNLIKHGVA